MGKPKMYGLKRTNPRLQVDLRWQRKQRQRNREKAPRVLDIGKGQEAHRTAEKGGEV